MSADDAPRYPCRPDPLSHPGRLGVSVLLDGRAPAPPSACRLLELGCSDGSHLLPIAARHPGAEIIGVERDPADANRARAAVRALGLDNLHVRAADLRSLDPAELGRFDYVVANGLLSWVPEDVRDAIFGLAGACLTERGAFYVSYNARPGWAVRGELREALLPWLDGVSGPRRRVARAREGLEAMRALLEDAQSDYGRLLQGEVSRALMAEDGYLLGEYLAEHNEPFHLSDVVERGAAAGLRMVTELTHASADGIRELVARQRLLAPFAAAPERAAPSPLASGRTLDLLLFRQLRRTVFSRADVASAPRAVAECLPELHLRGRLVPTGQIDLREGSPATFATASEATLTLEHALVKAAALELAAHPLGTVAYPALLERAQARLRSASVDAVHPLDESVSTLLTLGYVEAWIAAAEPADDEASKALAAHERETHGWESSPLHEAIYVRRPVAG